MDACFLKSVNHNFWIISPNHFFIKCYVLSVATKHKILIFFIWKPIVKLYKYDKATIIFFIHQEFSLALMLFKVFWEVKFIEVKFDMGWLSALH